MIKMRKMKVQKFGKTCMEGMLFFDLVLMC